MAKDRKNLGYWFLASVGLYLAMQAILRVLLGGTLETDEAEMALMAQDWRLGYGPQLPLYNWIQFVVFKIVGVNTAGLALAKFLVLWVAAAGFWFAMSAGFEDERAALIAALSLAFLPIVIWEMQRAGSHSIALVAAVSWTLWATIRVMKRGNTGDWIAIGLIIGLGGLSKYNYWVMPVCLAVASVGLWPKRVALSRTGPVLATLLSLVIVVPPYLWAINHPSKALASVHEFFDPSIRDWPWWLGPVDLLVNSVAGILLAGLVAFTAWLLMRRPPLGPIPWSSHLMLRAGGLALALALVMVLIFDVTRIQGRWLAPAFMLIVAALFGWLGGQMTQRGFMGIVAAALACAALTLAGMAEHRLSRGSTATLDFAPLVDLVRKLDPDVVEGSKLVGGNLRVLADGPRYDLLGTASSTGNWPNRLLFLGDLQDLPEGLSIRDQGLLHLKYPGSDRQELEIPWHLITD